MGKQHKRIEELGRSNQSPRNQSPKREDKSRESVGNSESNQGQANGDGGGGEEKQEREQEEKNSGPDLVGITREIDAFLSVIAHASDPPEPPDSVVEKFSSVVEKVIAGYESKKDRRWVHDQNDQSLLDAIDRVCKLSAALSAFKSDPRYKSAADRAAALLQRAMAFLEEEFRILLEGSRTTDTQQPAPGHEPEAFPTEVVELLQRIAGIMISAGSETECCQAFSIARRNAAVPDLGFQKIGIDEAQNLPWESLEAEIATWTAAFRRSISVSFPQERALCNSVFAPHNETIARILFSNLARSAIIQLLGFTEAVSTTGRSAEKLFKVLDMYEALRDMLPEIDGLFPGDEGAAGLKSEISSARARLGEAGVEIFCDLEGSIKADAAKTPVPGGAVHPLTRYLMNYLKYACEYKNSLEQVFVENRKDPKPSSDDDDSRTPFAAQLVGVMDLLDSNLDSKSKLYRDPALINIFLMNNGRYIVKKIKESAEIYQLLGDVWYRKRLGEMRQYHKNYQRDTWGKVLGCLKDEGIQVKGNVSKAVVKERLKSFNAMVEEIHKTQSSWVVSDEQLQSELRVSVSAVVVPAYRSFLGKYKQYVSSGKHVKFAPEDLEAYIDELFDGSPSTNHAKRRG